MDINGKNEIKYVENKTGILYNNIINELQRDVAQLGSAFVLGTKCHGFKSCHPYLSITSSLSNNKGSIAIKIEIN